MAATKVKRTTDPEKLEKPEGDDPPKTDLALENACNLERIAVASERIAEALETLTKTAPQSITVAGRRG